MTEKIRHQRLNAGDRFRFADGTVIEVHDPDRGMLRRNTSRHEQFIVLRAEPTRPAERSNCLEDWGVWAVPTGTQLDEIQNRTIHFYQEGGYSARALVDVVLIESASRRTPSASAFRTI